jgi:hypothetical protein
MQETDFLENTNFLELAEIHRQCNEADDFEIAPELCIQARSLLWRSGPRLRWRLLKSR